jgi:hypothetical protein
MRAIRVLLPRLAVALLGTLLALAASELVLRARGPSPRGEGLRGLHEARPDRRWIYGLRPGIVGRIGSAGGVEYRVNEDGFRGPRYARPKPPGVHRLLVVGDSVAFGFAVEEGRTFPRLMEERLARIAPGARIEVPALAVGGYNPYTEAALLEDVGVTYEPDLVLVQFCINDLNDPTLHFDAQTRLHLGNLPDAAYPDPSRRHRPLPTPALLARCRPWSQLCARLDGLLLGWLAPPADEAAWREAVRFLGADAGPEWAWLEARYGEMSVTAAAAGARFAVLAFPHPPQLGGDGEDPVQQRLLEMGARRGWVTIDPLPAFRRVMSSGGGRLFLDWWHPTELGHRIAAEVTVEDLACRGMLPAAVPCEHHLGASGR